MQRKHHGEEGSEEVKMETVHETIGGVKILKSLVGFRLFGDSILHGVNLKYGGSYEERDAQNGELEKCVLIGLILG